MENTFDNDGMSLKECINNWANIMGELIVGKEQALKDGDNSLAEMYDDSIKELKKDLKKKTFNGECVMDKVQAEILRRKLEEEELETSLAM